MKRFTMIMLVLITSLSFVCASGTAEETKTETKQSASNSGTSGTNAAAAGTSEAEEKEVVYGPKIGVTLYTLRNEYNAIREAHMASGMDEKAAVTEALTETLRRIAAMGYKGYQPNHANTNWWYMDAAELKALNEELGLTIISPHWVTAWDYSDKELAEIFKYLDAVGADGISLDISLAPGYNWFDQMTQSMMSAWVVDVAEKFRYMQDQIRKNGYDLQVGFHAHSLEWIPVDSYGGRYMLDILYDEFGDEILWHFDTSHAVHPNVGLEAIYPFEILGEEGLIKYLWAHGDQYRLIHAKDVDCEGYYTTACGQGDIEWNEVLRAMAFHGLEWLLVEDNSPGSYNRDGWGSIKVSIDYFNEMYISLGLSHPE